MHDDVKPRAARTPDEPAAEALFLADLHREMAAAVDIDPGPDPTWDPGDWPTEGDPTWDAGERHTEERPDEGDA